MVLTRLVVMMVTVTVMMMAGHVQGLQDYVAMQTLRTKLLENYDKNTMPADGRNPIKVNVSSFSVRNLYMDESKHQVHLHGWFHFTWKDVRLTWTPEEHSGLKKLFMHPKDLWMPDFSAYNSGDAANTNLGTSISRVIVFPNGEVLQVPPLDLVYNCVADLTYWPDDSHACNLKIGSWVHDAYLLDMILPADLKPSSEVTKEPEGEMDTMGWKIDDSSRITRKETVYECCEEPYVSMNVNLVLVRLAPAYCWLIKIPAVCFTLLTLVIFLLPPDAGEKVTFGGVCLLLHLIFLVFAHGAVSSAPTHTPLIVQLVVVEVVLVTASVVVAATVVRLARTPNTTPPPAALARLARSLAPALLLSAYANEASGSEEGSAKTDEVELADRGGDKAEKQRVAGAQWLLLGAFIDRLALLVCIVVIVVVLGRFSMVL